MHKKLLIVDDERLILKSLERLFRNSPYTVYTADNATDALQMIANESIGVLVSDFSMPCMTGASLLAKAKSIRPEMMRIILSGNSDQAAVINSINEGAAHRYLSKPWDDTLLIAEIDQAFAVHQKTRQVGEFEHLLTKRALSERIEYLQSSSSQEHVAFAFTPRGKFFQQNSAAQKILQNDVSSRVTSALCLADKEVALGMLGDSSFCLVFPREADRDTGINEVTQNLPDQIVLDGVTIPVSFYQGYACQSPISSAKQLLKDSVTALQEASRLKSLKPLRHSAKQQEQHNRRLLLESKLYFALSKNELSLHYQPKIDATTHNLIGAEALIRWNNADLGFVSPAEFIPISESNGQIIPIGYWVMAQGIDQWQAWFEGCDSQPIISINISTVQLQDQNLLPSVKQFLKDTSINPACLELELTESNLMDNTGTAKQLLTELKALGIHLSIDDFGTGFSSLSYLSELPVDTIKIDRSFVSPILESKRNESLVKNIINIAKDLGKETVAEGVETKEQLQKLTALGCDTIQGYYFSKPLPVEDFEKQYCANGAERPFKTTTRKASCQ